MMQKPSQEGPAAKQPDGIRGVRTVPMSSNTLLHHLELYLQYRLDNRIGMLPAETGEFRGLSPDLPVIFSNRGAPFVLARKKRTLQDGTEEEYPACDALEQLFRNLYLSGGYKGASSYSGRRSFATSLIQDRGCFPAPGASVDFTLPYLEPSKAEIRKAFESALGEISDEEMLEYDKRAAAQQNRFKLVPIPTS